MSGMMRRARGRAVTLIEAVLFISIALGLIVGGLVFFQQASTAQRTADTVRLVTGLVAETRALAQQGAFPTDEDLSDVLVAANAVPTNAVFSSDPDCGIKSPWGSCILVYNNLSSGGLAGFVELHFYAMPREICARIGHFDSEGNGPLGDGQIVLATLEDADSWQTGGGWSDVGLGAHQLQINGPLPPSLAGEMCTHAIENNNGIVAIGFSWQ